MLLDVAHRVVDNFAHLCGLGQCEEVIETGAGLKVENTVGVVRGRIV